MAKKLKKLDFSFEKRKDSFRKSKKSELSSEKALVFSKKIVAMLEDKLKKSNLSNLNIKDLKQAYKSGFNPIYSDINKESLARVNSLIRSLNNPKDLLNYFKSNEINFSQGKIVIQGDLIPDQIDYEQAEKDIVEYKLEDFDFKNLDELYLEDEDEAHSRFDWEY